MKSPTIVLDTNSISDYNLRYTNNCECIEKRLKMIIDITETILTPGEEGKNCLGNGMHYDGQGNLIECCCEECDYYLECFPC